MKATTKLRIIVLVLLILTLPIIKFVLVKDNYVYYRQLEIFLRTNSDFVPILFPIIMVLAYSIYFVSEQSNNYLQYVNSRMSLEKYFSSKLIVNATISFITAFLIIFLPFIFIMYIEPLLNIITLSPAGENPIPYTTFEQLLTYGTLSYGALYSFWIGVNGALYASFSMLLLMLNKQPLIAFGVPFIYYTVGNFLTQLLSIDQFSPTLSLFPFSISQQQIWTIFIPFSILFMINIVLFLILIRSLRRSYE
nr:ABC transporter permease [Salipaludibacillus agaradhaerens]